MTIFLDTNTILDHLLGRRFAIEMKTILYACETGQLTAFISTASVYTLTYFIQQKFSVTETKAILEDYLQTIRLLETNKLNITQALKSNFKDLEDAYQYQVALNEPTVHYFVTGNTKDFKHQSLDSITVITPAELVNLL